MLVNLTYFKSSGKSYTSASYETSLSPTAGLFEVWDEVVTMMQAKKLPGLTEGAGEELSVLVDVPDHPHRHLRLLVPDASTSEAARAVAHAHDRCRSAEIDTAYRAGFVQGRRIGWIGSNPVAEREVSVALDRWASAYTAAATSETPGSPEDGSPRELGLVDALYVRVEGLVGAWISREFRRLEQYETAQATIEITIQAPKEEAGELRCEIQSASRSVDYPNAARLGLRSLR